MKSIRTTNWHDLLPYGIDALTGEACAYGMRILCDVNEDGADTIRAFFGLPSKAPLSEPWNSGKHMGGSMGSVMLPYSIMVELSVFCVLRDGAHTVALCKDYVFGYYAEDDQKETDELLRMYERIGVLIRTYRRSSSPGSDDRNTHQTTGRTF